MPSLSGRLDSLFPGGDPLPIVPCHGYSPHRRRRPNAEASVSEFLDGVQSIGGDVKLDENQDVFVCCISHPVGCVARELGQFVAEIRLQIFIHLEAIDAIKWT
jgi:hypothetical protein